MTEFNLKNARECVQQFDFKTLLIEELGWSYPPTKKSSSVTVDGFEFEQRPLAELGGSNVSYERILESKSSDLDHCQS